VFAFGFPHFVHLAIAIMIPSSGCFSYTLPVKESNYFFDSPNMVCDSSFHCRGNAKRLMDAREEGRVKRRNSRVRFLAVQVSLLDSGRPKRVLSPRDAIAIIRCTVLELTTWGTISLESQTFSELQASSKPGVEPSFVRINRLLIGSAEGEKAESFFGAGTVRQIGDMHERFVYMAELAESLTLLCLI
jgi:hypothetical protein